MFLGLQYASCGGARRFGGRPGVMCLAFLLIYNISGLSHSCRFPPPSCQPVLPAQRVQERPEEHHVVILHRAGGDDAFVVIDDLQHLGPVIEAERVEAL